MLKKDEFINKNIALVHVCAKKFKGKGIEYDDLFQAGCLGLVKAFNGFDENKGFKFSTYAVPVILGEIKRLFRDGGTIKVSRSLKELSIKATREINKFRLKFEREPTISEIAKALNVDIAEASQAISSSILPISLTAHNENGEKQIDIPIEFPEEKISENLALKQIIKNLNSNDKTLIDLRFFKGQTQTQAGKTLGLTQVQVSRKEKALFKKIRNKLL